VLIGTSILNYIFGTIIFKVPGPKYKKLTFLAVIVINLSILGIFKYYNFFRTSFELMLRKVGILFSLPALEFILPIGLSFYIFKALSFDIDLYSKKIGLPNFTDFLIYLAFFPELLSGPISRPSKFIPQLNNKKYKITSKIYKNFILIFLGILKKILLAGYLSTAIQDVLAVSKNYSSLTVLASIFIYSLVIYFDFSGYSDLAIGFSGLLGFHTPRNFNTPYLSSNIQEFWRRWHITLSSWIRDYIYIPLGGNRKGLLRKYFNLLVSMLLAGLWHGAGLHFIIWGVLHGIALVLFHFIKDRWPSFIEKTPKILMVPINFIFISFAWVFFSQNTRNALEIIKNIFRFSTRNQITSVFPPIIVAIIVISFLFLFFENKITMLLNKVRKIVPFTLWAIFIALLISIIFMLGPKTIPPFIYFSF